RRTRALVDVTGVGGGIARGLVFAAAGAFAVRAAVDYEPDRAKGLDDTLRSFAQTPAGPWLLAGVAAGLVLFGMFSFALARWRRVCHRAPPPGGTVTARRGRRAGRPPPRRTPAAGPRQPAGGPPGRRRDPRCRGRTRGAPRPGRRASAGAARPPRSASRGSTALS